MVIGNDCQRGDPVGKTVTASELPGNADQT